MKIELWQLFLVVVGYLGLLFVVAYAAEKSWIPKKVVSHPVTYVLSLGVYATSWTYYGSVGFAATTGLGFLTIYLGVTIAFLLAPILLIPILRLVREYQLSSLADLFAFRFRSPFTGLAVTLFMLIGTLPYISLQIQAVAESIQVLTQEKHPEFLAPAFCVTLTIFAILFGARHITPREKHGGLVAAIAFESAVKLLALLAVGAFAVYGVFGGFNELQAWTRINPEAIAKLYNPVVEGPWVTLLFLAFCAAFLLPRQFHMTFAENMNPDSLRHAAWMFPLYLLLLNLPIVPILWAGEYLQLPGSPEYYVLSISLGRSDLLSIFTFIGGISAASAMMIVTTLALATMVLNHIILPAGFLGDSDGRAINFYRWILWGKRLLIGVIIAGGYGFYRIIVNNEGLVRLGLVSFVAVAQLLPGILALLFWKRATRYGFISGLVGGALVWFGVLILPLLVNADILNRDVDITQIFQQGDVSIWTVATFWSLAANSLLLVVISLLTTPDREEWEAAEACAQQGLRPLRGQVTADSPEQFQKQLARVIGESAAGHEVDKALEELGLDQSEQRPAELRLLRDRIERNLSGLLGPVLAQLIVDNRLQLKQRSHIALADSIRFMEERLKDSHSRMRGVVAELDSLRRYHREILYELPLGVCALSPEREVLIWNFAMQVISGIDERTVVGKKLLNLPEPWNNLLSSFAESEDIHRHKQALNIGETGYWFNLHKAEIDVPDLGQPSETPGLAIIVEDRTEIETLEAGLAHSERLASIGRLAAGVAHEIGNPLTGIASLAQNLKHETDQSLVSDSVKDILLQTERINQIVRSLLTFSHAEHTAGDDRHEFSLDSCIEEAIRLVGMSHSGKQIECILECSASLRLYADRQKILQMFVNLLSNACDASHPGDHVWVKCRSQNNLAHIRVIDQGSGIPDELHDRIFEPFFTTKNVGEGTGLGLPLVHSIVRDHDGEIEINTKHKKGTEFVLRLPIAIPKNKSLGVA